MTQNTNNLFEITPEFFELVLNSLTTGVYICDNNFIVRFINQTYADYLSQPREAVMGRPITDFIPDSRAPFVIKTGLAEIGDIRTFKSRDGDRVVVVNRLPLKHGSRTIGMLSHILFNSREEFDAANKRISYLDKKLASYANRIKSAFSPRYSLRSIIGESEAMKRFRSHLLRYAGTDSPVLILGATGTGKELAANALHCESARREGPFVSINCAAIPKELFESELFGYAPGAFSGAHKDGKVGQLELADCGTLFLDEVGDTPLPAQAKLLRVLENRTLYRVGSTQPRSVDFRLIAATNRDLKAMIAQGAFREDLYYRLSPLILNVPSLRQRQGDIILLVRHILEHMGHGKITVTGSAMQALSTYCWPGNIRELRNVLTSAISLCRNQVIDMGDLPPELLSDYGSCPLPLAEELPTALPAASGGGVPAASLPTMLANNELRLIILTLQEYNWNVAKSARVLGISRATLYEKLKKYGITRHNC